MSAKAWRGYEKYCLPFLFSLFFSYFNSRAYLIQRGKAL